MNEEKCQCDGFAEMGEYLRETWHLGHRKLNLWAYLVVAVVGVGGVSIWLSLVFHYKEISRPAILLSICTFSPMIVSAGCFDYLFDIDKRRFLLGFSILVAFLVVLLDAVSLIIKDEGNKGGLFVGVFPGVFRQGTRPDIRRAACFHGTEKCWKCA